MKKSNIIVKTLTAITIGAIIVTSCSKSNSTTTTSDDQATAVTLTASSATSDNLYDDVFNEVMNVNDENGLSTGRIAADGSENRVDSLGVAHGCAAVTISPKDQSTYPKTIIIDYGAAGCVGANGITRKGQITYTVSGKLHATGTVFTVSFNNYSANGYLVEGTYTITNNSTDNSLNISTKIMGGKITFPDASYYAYSGTKTMLQTAGMSTTTPGDDIYSVTGNNSCSSSAGNTVTITITTPLIKNASCKNIVSGTAGIAYNYIKGVFDYGNGTCDNQATLTIGNSVQAITLP